MTPPSIPTQLPIAGQRYAIIAKHSGLALDVRDRSTSDGARLQQWAFAGDGGANQKWIPVSLGNGLWQLRSVLSNKCTDVSDVSTNDGAPIQQWSCHSGSNQQFRLESQGDGYFYVRAVNSGKCLNVIDVSRENGAGIQQWSCGGDNAKWRFQLTK